MDSISGVYAEEITILDPSTCHFYHTMDLPEFGVQKGEWDLRGDFERYIGGVSLEGKRVLDIGCGAGFLSFSAEQRGAREVVSFDMDDACRQHWLPFHEKLAYRSPAEFAAQHNLWLAKWRNAYWLSHRLLGSRAKAIYGDVYEFPQEAGQFDVVFVCSILEHLADPIRALASITRVAASEIVITTSVIKTEDKIARFDGDASRPDIDFAWWTYSIGTYRHVLRMLGFGIVSISEAEYRFELADSLANRTTIVARRGAIDAPASPDPSANGAASKWPRLWRRFGDRS